MRTASPQSLLAVTLLAVSLAHNSSGLAAQGAPAEQGQTPEQGSQPTPPASTEPDCKRIEFVKQVEAPYPPEAKQQNIVGQVMLRVHLSATADITRVDVVSGDPILAGSAASAAKEFKFKSLDKKPPASGCGLNLEFRFSGSDFGELRRRIRLSEGASGRLLIHRVQPEYPAAAVLARIEGTVVLQVVIKEDGNVESTKPISGPPELFSAAMDAVQQWRYRPYLLNGEVTAVETEVIVTFKL